MLSPGVSAIYAFPNRESQPNFVSSFSENHICYLNPLFCYLLKRIIFFPLKTLRSLCKKLPDKFKIDTPVGNYNPDWAIIKQVDGKDHIYMIRETKSTLDESNRRPTENAKIKAAEKHFEAIGLKGKSVDYNVGVPGNWRS
jgi:hypothetical protein